MRCVYCHNPDIVLGKSEKTDADILAFLKSRVSKLKAVVFSGGEATLYQGLPALMREAKELGFKVKLDTNGSRPQVLKQILDEKLVDYVAMDFKAPPEKLESIVGTAKLFEPFKESLTLLIEASSADVMPAKAGVTEEKTQKKITFEVRTTIHPDLLNVNDITWMIRFLEEADYRGTYYLQLIQSTGEKTIGNVDEPLHTFDRAKLPEPTGFALGFRNFKD